MTQMTQIYTDLICEYLCHLCHLCAKKVTSSVAHSPHF